MQKTTILIILLFIIIIGCIWLQVLLSKKESKWFGLILPFICFAYSLVMISSIAVFDGMTGWDIFCLVASTFLIANIPTLILVAIYFSCRGKIKRYKELEKMNIQDLE